jgi:hypothetical protein
LIKTEYAVPSWTLSENLLRQPRASELRDVHYGNISLLEIFDGEDMKDVVIENAVLLRKSRQKERRRQRQRLFSSYWLL